MYTYNEAFEESLRYFGGDDLAAKVFVDKYALRDNKQELVERSPADMHKRIASEIHRIEEKKFKSPLSYDKIYSYFEGFRKIVPQGSPMYGIGNRYQYATLSNCYVLETPIDSYAGIHRTDEEISQISKRRGGCGIDISELRPSGFPTQNAARTSTGIIPFLERFSNSIREVGQAGRRGALMVTISVHHPQVLDFTTIKRDLTKVTGANISIRLSDEFLNAVDKGTDYEQRWPVNSKEPTIRRMVPAREVWMEIIKNAHAMAEPGLLFWDTIIRESPADCYSDLGYKTVSTNPCSELPLSELDSCRLFLINLYSYVKNPFMEDATFKYDEFYEDCKVLQRFMDDVVDLELESIDKIIEKIKRDPESEDIKATELGMWKKIRVACFNGRRTGSGITALGDCLAALGVKYGSDESIEITEKVYKTLKLACYRSSVDMAKEIGAFPIWEAKREESHSFLSRIKDEDPSLYEDMQKHGRRNIALLTTAPAGSVSIETQTTSGIEPVFMMNYTRRKKINPNDKNAKVDFVDQNGDSWQEFVVYHPRLKEWMYITGSKDITKSPYYGCCAEDLDWKQRVKLQAVAHKHVDHSISSTINLPEDVCVEKVAEIYETAWKAGCFLSGNDVYTFNGIKDVSKICKGDLVYSHDGTLQKVKDVFDLPEELREFVNLKITGHEKISATSEHPFLIIEVDRKENKLSWKDRTKKLKWKKAEEINIGDHVVIPKINNRHIVENLELDLFKYIDSPCLVENDRIFLTRPLPWKEDKLVKAANSNSIPRRLPVTDEFCEFIGWFIAEGHYDGESFVRLTFNPKTEKPIAEKIKKYIESAFGVVGYYEDIYSGNGHSWRLQFGCKLLSNVLSKMVGIYSENKHLPDWFVHLPKDKLKIILDCHFAGDAGVTTSKRLARELFFANLLIDRKPYFGENHGEGYCVAEKTSRCENLAKEFGNYLCYRVFDIEKFASADKVYNFSVENNDSYLVNGCAVHNCKGITVYRKNCRTGVLVENKKDDGRKDKIIKNSAPRRPTSVPCGLHHVTIKGKEYFVLVGQLAGEPYEIFAGHGNINKNAKNGELVKLARGKYKVVFEDKMEVAITNFCNDEEEALTRLVSTSLRHGADVNFIVHQLEKVKGDMTGFAKSIARVLKKYIPDGTKVHGEVCQSCGSESLNRQEGCVTCMSCAWSKCM